MGETLPVPDVRRHRLKELEAVIASGWAEVVRVGQALREIRDERLYLELGEGITFEDYCKTRWAISRRYALNHIDAADVHDAVAPMAPLVPITTERAARELAPILRDGGPKKVAEAWSKVSERYEGQRPPTAKEVHRVLVEEGYRPKVGQVSGGKQNTRILLGQVGDRIAAVEKRLEWFLVKDASGREIGKDTRALALEYATRLEVIATTLKKFGEAE